MSNYETTFPDSHAPETGCAFRVVVNWGQEPGPSARVEVYDNGLTTARGQLLLSRDFAAAESAWIGDGKSPVYSGEPETLTDVVETALPDRVALFVRELESGSRWKLHGDASKCAGLARDAAGAAVVALSEAVNAALAANVA